MAYLLDTNVFIEARNRHYGFDFCPAFWDWIDHAHHAGTVFSLDKVAIELDAVDDDLATWASERPTPSSSKPTPPWCRACRPPAPGPTAPGTSRLPSPPSCRTPTTTWLPTPMPTIM